MADGKTHEKYLNAGWIIIIPLGGILIIILDWGIIHLFFLYFNYWLTDFISPDLDHSMMTRDEHDAKRKSKNASLALFVPHFLVHKKSWFRKFLKRFNLGILGALFVSWSQIYEYFSSIFGGHRSWFSHGIIFGTLTRMVWFNAPLSWMMLTLVQHSILVWGHPPWGDVGFRYYYMNVWLVPYLTTQFVSWFIGDGIHLILDSSWAKGRLYGFEKFGDKRNHWQRWLTKRINTE